MASPGHAFLYDDSLAVIATPIKLENNDERVHLEPSRTPASSDETLSDDNSLRSNSSLHVGRSISSLRGIKRERCDTEHDFDASFSLRPRKRTASELATIRRSLLSAAASVEPKPVSTEAISRQTLRIDTWYEQPTAAYPHRRYKIRIVDKRNLGKKAHAPQEAKKVQTTIETETSEETICLPRRPQLLLDANAASKKIIKISIPKHLRGALTPRPSMPDPDTPLPSIETQYRRIIVLRNPRFQRA